MPGASSGHTREPHAGRASPALASGIALLFGLAPGGVYRADPVTRAAGELLPHRFTLTARRERRFAFCGTDPWGRPPWPLTSTLPCGARTFLPRELPRAGDHPAFSGAIKERVDARGSIAPRGLGQPRQAAARSWPMAATARRSARSLGIARVAGDLVPGDLMPLGLGDQRLPEIAVLDRLLLGVLPAVPAPALVPLVAKAIDDVGAVAVEVDAARAVGSERRPSRAPRISMR